MPSHRTTGLTTAQLAVLCEKVKGAAGVWQRPTGRRRCVPLSLAVKVTVMHFKNNLSQAVIGELVGISQASVSRLIGQLEPVIAAALADYVPPPEQVLAGRVTLVDGTLTPCWSWKRPAAVLRQAPHHRPQPPGRLRPAGPPAAPWRPAARTHPRHPRDPRHRPARAPGPGQHDRR